MDLSTLDDARLRHPLIPHRDQSSTYGISSSSSFFPDKFLPAIDPSIFWDHPPTLHPPPPPPQDNGLQMAINLPYHPLPQYPYEPQDDPAPPGAREKRHCCQLCPKRFDRPSTLKKHMLVHTGEKAWACEICRRRFSVSSNLNRHTRRCREKWAKADNSATPETPTTSPSSSPFDQTVASPSSSTTLADSPDPYRPPSPQLTGRPNRRQSAAAQGTTVQYETDDGSRPHDQQHVAGKSHRRRRKGSPTEPWVPASLVNFNLDPITGSAPTPLPAVVPNPNPNKPEERNSYDNTPLQAYHPSCWTGRLVGPGYAQRREELSRGRFCGKVLVF